MYNDTASVLKIFERIVAALSSGRRGTGFAGPQAASPARGEAATQSESATGVNQ